MLCREESQTDQKAGGYMPQDTALTVGYQRNYTIKGPSVVHCKERICKMMGWHPPFRAS